MSAQGLRNHGNTCFMNAMVQCLSNTAPLAAFLALGRYRARGARAEVTHRLAALVRALWTRDYTPQLSAEFKFEDIQDVISRYKLLVRTRKDLQQSQEKDKETIKQTKVLLDQDEAEKEAETLRYQNELEQLQQRFAQAQSDVRFWTARWADMQNRNAKNGLMLTTMKMAIHNLFQCVNTQLKAKVHVPEDDSLRQLDMIQQSVLDLKDIVMEVKRRTWRATSEQLSTSIKGKRRTESPSDVVLRP